jgi:hypothetical protein
MLVLESAQTPQKVCLRSYSKLPQIEAGNCAKINASYIKFQD